MNLNNLRGQLSSRGSLSGGLTVGAGGTSDYDELENKPQINGRELIDNQTGHDLGLANLTDVSDLAADVALLSQKLPKNYSTDEQNTGIKWLDGKYIYQKSYSLSEILILRTGGTEITVIDFSDIKLFINGFGIYDGNNEEQTVPLTIYRLTNNKVFFVPNIDIAVNKVTLFYTKNE